jgi:hypothetical protein
MKTDQSETIDGGGGGNAAPVKVTGIAILGSHPATVEMAPFDQPDWLIYACSPHNFEKRRLPRFDAWFEVHIPVADSTRAYPYLKYLETLPLVWMRDKAAMGHFPGAKPYPEDELKAEFGPFTFTSSIAFMLAMAIKDCERLGAKQIALFGIMQASPNEYAYQRPGIQNLIWEATRRGIKVVAPDISKLFEPPPEEF